MKPLPVIILILVFVSDVILGTEYQDYTSIFKNRVALFEYKYYPGYWSYPYLSGPLSFVRYRILGLGYNRNLEDAKANNLYHWTLHDCGNVPAFQESWLVDYASDNSTLCIQSNSETFKGNWITYWWDSYNYDRIRHVAHHNIYDVSQTNSLFRHKIFCTQCSTGEIFQNCRISNVGGSSPIPPRYWYTNKRGKHLMSEQINDESWYSWRIAASETKIYWRSHIVDNCEGIEDLPAVITMTTSVTSSSTTTHSIEEKLTIAAKATKLLKNVVFDFKSETSYAWTYTKTKEFAKGKIVTLGSNGSNGKLVKPGWKWVVSQLVGVADFAEISTDRYKSTDLQCNT